MSSSPLNVTNAFTLSDPSLAWLILNGTKIIENRNFKMTAGWYAVHVGSTAHCPIATELPLIKEFGMPSVLSMQKGVVSGVCRIEGSLPASQCKDNRWAMPEQYKFCNIITKVIRFDGGETVKARGNLGSWPLKDSEERVRELTKQAIQLGGLRKNTNAIDLFGHLLDAQAKEGAAKGVKRPAEEAAPKAKGTPGAVVKKAKCQAGPSAEPAKTTKPVNGSDIRSFLFKK